MKIIKEDTILFNILTDICHISWKIYLPNELKVAEVHQICQNSNRNDELLIPHKSKTLANILCHEIYIFVNKILSKYGHCPHEKKILNAKRMR